MKVMVGSSRARTISGKNISRRSAKLEKVNKGEREPGVRKHIVFEHPMTHCLSSISHHFFLRSSCIPRVGERILLATHFILFTTNAYEQSKENQNKWMDKIHKDQQIWPYSFLIGYWKQNKRWCLDKSQPFPHKEKSIFFWWRDNWWKTWMFVRVHWEIIAAQVKKQKKWCERKNCTQRRPTGARNTT